VLCEHCIWYGSIRNVISQTQQPALIIRTIMNLNYKPVDSDVWKATSRIQPTFTFASPVLNDYILSQPIFHVCRWLLINYWTNRHFCSVAVILGRFMCISDFTGEWRLSDHSVFILFIITAKLQINTALHCTCTSMLYHSLHPITPSPCGILAMWFSESWWCTYLNPRSFAKKISREHVVMMAVTETLM